MGELDKKKRKHDHSLTDLLKVGIFSLVMLAPFISVGVRCGYVMWNKNAKDSYSQSNYLTLTNIDDYQNNQNLTYYISPTQNSVNYTSNTNLSYTLNMYNVNVLSSNLTFDITNTDRLTATIGLNYGQRTCYYVFYENNTTLGAVYGSAYNWRISCNINSISTATSFGQVSEYNQSITYLADTNYLDNAFSYSIAQISNDPIFNWTRNTGMYTPINAMVTGLEIENDTLQILLAYWSLMTAVYIVFDLIIFCFTKLTHFINE